MSSQNGFPSEQITLVTQTANKIMANTNRSVVK